MVEDQLRGDARPQGVAQHVRPIDAERVEQGGRVPGHVPEPVVVGLRLALAGVAVVHGHDPEAGARASASCVRQPRRYPPAPGIRRTGGPIPDSS